MELEIATQMPKAVDWIVGKSGVLGSSRSSNDPHQFFVRDCCVADAVDDLTECAPNAELQAMLTADERAPRKSSATARTREAALEDEPIRLHYGSENYVSSLENFGRVHVVLR